MAKQRSLWWLVRKTMTGKISRNRASHAAWEYYTRLVGILAAPSDDVYLSSGVKMGRIGEGLTLRLTEAFGTARMRPLRLDDHPAGYVSNDAIAYEIDEMNRAFRYREIEPRHLDLGELVCTEIDPSVRACLGTGWRVVNMKALETHPESGEAGQNSWHTDHFPEGLHKVLLYLTAIGPGLGSTEIRTRDGRQISVEGPPGTWILFEPSKLEHRGLPPAQRTRLILEITLMPAFVSDNRPIFAGQNASYPRYPWVRRPKTASGGARRGA